MTCKHEHIGRKMVDHGNGVQHPGAVQFCLECNLTLSEILKNERKEGATEICWRIRGRLTSESQSKNHPEYSEVDDTLKELLTDYLK